MNVLLVRLDGIGDAAVCAPLVAELLAAGHRVGAALTTRNAALFSDAVAPVHVLERIPWPRHGSTPESSARAHAAIVAQRYDVALIASEEPEAYELAAAVPERAGFVTGWAKPLKSAWVRRRVTRAVRRSAGDEGAHEAEILYRLGAGLVARTAPPDDPARLRAVLVERDAPPRRRDVVVQLGPKWTASGVDAADLRALVAALVDDGARVVAAPGDAAFAAEVTGAGVALDVPATLDAWKRTLDEAGAVVTVDTGAAHVAGMLGVPVVDVFPDDGFAAQTTRWRPWAAPHRLLRASALRGDAPQIVREALDALR